MTSLREHLEREERRLLAEIVPLRTKLDPLEVELLDVQRALRAVGGIADPVVARPGPSTHTWIRKRTEAAVQTMSDAIRAILHENPGGMTSHDIHKLCEARVGRALRDENVRGQLSRMKKNGEAAWFDGLWYKADAVPAPTIGRAHS